MVITRSHINEQISKGGKKMVTRPRRNLADIAKREWQLKQQRKRAKKARGMKTQDPVKHMRKEHSAPKKPTRIHEPRQGTKKKDPTVQTKKDIEQKFGDKRDPLKEIKGTRKAQKMIFGGQEIKVPGRKYAKGGDVVMQKVRKYKEGGTVVHDQSTIKNL